MPITLQVTYPISDGTHFDYDYYAKTHMALVAQHFGPHMTAAQASKGLAGGPDTPSPYYAIATLTFADQDALNAAMADGAAVVGDIPNFTNVRPNMMIGEVMA